MFKLDTNYLDWQLKVAQSQNQDKYEDPVKKIIQIGLQSSCSIYVHHGDKHWSGSGFHIGDGIIITAAHVVPPDIEIDVDITFDNKNYFKAQTIISEPNYDAGILSAPQVASLVPQVELGDSDTIEVGDIVAVIGSPEGFHDTATVGRVTNIHQTLGESAPTPAWRDIIFIDADILEGSSGGMVIGTDGKVYGLIMGVTGQHSDIGVGENSACPSNKIRELLTKI